jgi:hypothetical protein
MRERFRGRSRGRPLPGHPGPDCGNGSRTNLIQMNIRARRAEKGGESR